MIKKLLTAGIGLFLLSCQSPEPVEGPYFANGVKNGWADQKFHCIVDPIDSKQICQF